MESNGIEWNNNKVWLRAGWRFLCYLGTDDGELQELVGLTDDTGSRQLNGIADAVKKAVPRLCQHFTNQIGRYQRFVFSSCNSLNFVQSISMFLSCGGARNLRTAMLGNEGPYMSLRSLWVSATLMRFHWVMRLIRWRHVCASSLSVFHIRGDGKQRAHAWSHTSNKTLSTRSHNWSPMSSETQFHFITARYPLSCIRSCCKDSNGDALTSFWSIYPGRWAELTTNHWWPVEGEAATPTYLDRGPLTEWPHSGWCVILGGIELLAYWSCQLLHFQTKCKFSSILKDGGWVKADSGMQQQQQTQKHWLKSNTCVQVKERESYKK